MHISKLDCFIDHGSFYHVAVNVEMFGTAHENVLFCFDGMPVGTSNFSAVSNPKNYDNAVDVCVDMLMKLDYVREIPGTDEVDEEAYVDFVSVVKLLVDFVRNIQGMSKENPNIINMKNKASFPTITGVKVGVEITPLMDSTVFTIDYDSGIG